MFNKLSKGIEELELRLKQHESTERNSTYKAVLELTGLSMNCPGKSTINRKGPPCTTR